MKIAVTGATGFVGRHIVRQLLTEQHSCRCWHRPESDLSGFEDLQGIEWVPGELVTGEAGRELVAGCDAVVHAALFHPGGRFKGSEGNLVDFVQKNVVGTIALIEAARKENVGRFIFISSCAVHDQILDDRPLDETHPLWPASHYGAHKAAIEQFVHSYGLGEGYPICALRPTGVYGEARPVQDSKWFELVSTVMRGETVECSGGGKEVHASDVAKAVSLLLTAEGIAGQSYNCCDMFISDYEVASIANRISGGRATVKGSETVPKHQINTDKLRGLGMRFGGPTLLENTLDRLVEAAAAEQKKDPVLVG